MPIDRPNRIKQKSASNLLALFCWESLLGLMVGAGAGLGLMRCPLGQQHPTGDDRQPNFFRDQPLDRGSKLEPTPWR
jgi:hypothetical protein